jgi:protein-tyrosine phosphatase
MESHRLEDKVPNFRDLAEYTSKIKQNMIFRSSHLAPLCFEPFFNEFIQKYNFRTIIDLRWPTETNRFPYPDQYLQHVSYVSVALIDTPLNKKDWLRFIPYNEKGDFYEVIPKHFKNQVKLLFETLLFAGTPVLIHCWSGKDRTGMMVALILMLLNTPDEEIMKDYLATGMTTTPEKIQPFFNVIKEQGGINQYLNSTGFTSSDLNNIKLKYKREN